VCNPGELLQTHAKRRLKASLQVGFVKVEPRGEDPRINAICERVIGILRRELLDRTVILNERHLALVLREYRRVDLSHAR